MVRLLAERYDTKSNVKLGGFRSQLQASNVSSHTEELWYNETVCLWMTIYIERKWPNLSLLFNQTCLNERLYIYISGAEMGLVLLVPGTTNNSVNVI